MTTTQIKFALLKHFRYLGYPMVATECSMTVPGARCSIGTSIADVLAIKESLIAEVEIKQHRCEMTSDLKTKPKKHAFYLNSKSPWENRYKYWHEGLIRPHKFYFAYHLSPKNRLVHNAAYYPNLPAPYGLIIVYDINDCRILKRAKWLHRDPVHLQATKDRMCLRLVRENIYLKSPQYRHNSGGVHTMNYDQVSKCPKCNADLPFANQKFCTQCGKKLKQVVGKGEG